MDEWERRQILQKAREAVDRREGAAWEHREWLGRHIDKYGIIDLGEAREVEPSPQPQQELIFKTFETPPPPS
jgi:hypothetical protein